MLSVERQTVHVSDDTGRIAMLETLTVGSDGSLVELDDMGEIISYEERRSPHEVPLKTIKK